MLMLVLVAAIAGNERVLEDETDWSREPTVDR